MRILRPLSKILSLLPIVTLGYDLVNEWFVHARFKIRTLKEWWLWLDASSFSAMEGWISKPASERLWEKVISWPAPVALMIPPLVLYVIYRIFFAAKGGHGGGGYVYRSHD